MKTAKEWLSTDPLTDTGCEGGAVCICPRCKDGKEVFLLEQDIEAIQLDAFKAGAERAAGIAHMDPNIDESHLEQWREQLQVSQAIETAILTAAANLKEVPKV